LIDELDALITPKQTLLYNLFEWPCNSNSNLLVISIANTMDLPERLQSKITSRIGKERLVYEPYKADQIEMILESRLKDISIFEARSLNLVSKKVATVSGDIRRSLQITKRAVELQRDKYLAEKEVNPDAKVSKITVNDICTACDEMSNSKTVQVLKGLRKFEVLVVIALYLELKSSKQLKVLMDNV
jgi:origin recognition complex subunit 1|tara:strand:- start:518 stop:1078 length:561 start_codon:yes stop_codon:yes gene_type:complete